MRDRPTASLSKSQIEAFLSSSKFHRRTEGNPHRRCTTQPPALHPAAFLEPPLTMPPATSPPPVHPAAFLEPPPTSPRPTSPPAVHPSAFLEPTHDLDTSDLAASSPPSSVSGAHPPSHRLSDSSSYGARAIYSDAEFLTSKVKETLFRVFDSYRLFGDNYQRSTRQDPPEISTQELEAHETSFAMEFEKEMQFNESANKNEVELYLMEALEKSGVQFDILNW
ncbi:pectinesterase inhibitor 10-like [Arachis duranensis]|uniref:Pectinesterase inhibitor 10-like n=1 Tax=Arachis duranensis TaxID=130453 RepID=A0A9C6WVV6_ARADU|nr:pectinesterase inhibitor 10-like [Arachis duranensis]